MSTQQPSIIQQISTLLGRINRQIQTFLDFKEPNIKKDQQLHHSYSFIYQIALQTDSFAKLLIKKIGSIQRGYQQLLQKLQDKSRKHAKNHCQMKLYCQHLEQQLRNQKRLRKQMQQQLNFLTFQYNKQIQTLKTQLSHAAATKNYQQKPIQTTRNSIKPIDTLSKIKMRLLNIGNVQISQPLSCMNTIRNTNVYQDSTVHPFSQPNSLRNSPLNNSQKEIVGKQLKKIKSSKKYTKHSKSKGKHQQKIKQKSLSQSKLKNFKKK